jgi:GT2 family glycosyltransferase
VVKKDTLLELQLRMESEPALAFCGSVLLDYYQPEHIQCCGVNYYKYLGISKLYLKNRLWAEVQSTLAQSSHPPAYYQIGASLLADIPKLKEIGLMDEIFFLYSEETDWQVRARKLGYGSAISWKSILHHKGNVSTAGKKYLFFYHYNRSAVIMSRKNFGWLPPLTASFSLALITVLRSKFAVKSVISGIKGILAGWQPNHKTL